ncbi:hypothetical protein [Streptosporangium pseudovulgare]|uniref:Uncharacterized protein n=1 Tax=Streptosporangium pseudovulgare TaxID=35765 RepID=A0ABQ2QX99_9ACTN|nr:hypothetical protein [Streptosporangium pseudovulgare]GGQ02591.1 hypothetical protein GCM10010140_35970 [Streptosporangium pseudovulgare]
MSIRIRNTSAAQAPPSEPLKDDGTPYAYEMIDGWWRVYADDPAELVAELIPGYAAPAGEEERAAARLRLAVDFQVRLQARLAVDGNLDACTPEEQEVILADRAEPPAPPAWNAAVPLVLVTSHYEPHAPRLRPRAPAGAVIWLDPADELSLLTSLAGAGLIRLGRAA